MGGKLANEKTKEKKVLTILSGIGRYILGFIIMLSPLGITLIKGISPSFVVLGLLTPPITLFIAPQIIIGIYFMLTGKTKIRLDVTLLILVIICTIGLLSFNPAGV